MSDETAETLSRAGVGIAHHKRHLAQFGEAGATLKNWIESDSKSDIAMGRGVWVAGQSVDARNLFMVLAKGMILKHHDARVVSLSALAKYMASEVPEEIERCKALFVSHFYETGYDKCPLENYTRHLIEDYLMDRMDNHMGCFFHAMTEPTKIRWWTDLFVKRVSSEVLTVVVQ